MMKRLKLNLSLILNILLIVLINFQFTNSLNLPRELFEDNDYNNEAKASEYLKKLNQETTVALLNLSQAQWEFATNINNDTQIKANEAQSQYQKFSTEKWTETIKYNYANFDPKLKRQFEKYALLGLSALDEHDYAKFVNISSKMEEIYSSATIEMEIDGVNKTLRLDPDLDLLLANQSTSFETRQEAWIKWRDATGKKMRTYYIEYYQLGNKAATLNKIPGRELKTLDAIWLYPWETPELKDNVDKIWTEINDKLYKKLHAYVYTKLKQIYKEKMPKDGTIPAHIVGNMWAQSWDSIMNLPLFDPFPDIDPIDVTGALQSYTVREMFDISEAFFKGLGLEPMTDKFWDNSVLKRNESVEMVCHASAWDFNDDIDRDDFRIKQCTKLTQSDFITIHHEMGHIVYYMQYKNQPIIYREGANPGFHEAIGDLIALSVSTPSHLYNLGLLNEPDPNKKDNLTIKFQLSTALNKIAFLPFGYIMDKWRWDLFSGEVDSGKMNKHWWELRLKYQGISPPNKRGPDDFDPGAKYHIPASVEYIRYFVSHILQFQFHKALCELAGQLDNNRKLHECDIANSTAAGDRLKKVLQLGSSIPWPEQLKMFTEGTKSETNEMSAEALIDYFEPLIKFLDDALKELNVTDFDWKYDINEYYNFALPTRQSKLLVIMSSVLLIIYSLV